MSIRVHEKRTDTADLKVYLHGASTICYSILNHILPYRDEDSRKLRELSQLAELKLNFIPRLDPYPVTGIALYSDQRSMLPMASAH